MKSKETNFDRYLTNEFCLSWAHCEPCMPELFHRETCLSCFTKSHASVVSQGDMPELFHRETCLSCFTKSHAWVVSLSHAWVNFELFQAGVVFVSVPQNFLLHFVVIELQRWNIYRNRASVWPSVRSTWFITDNVMVHLEALLTKITLKWTLRIIEHSSTSKSDWHPAHTHSSVQHTAH